MIEKVKELLSKQLKIDLETIEDDANILDDLGADSLDIVEMLMTLESEFGILVPDEDVMGLKTVRSVAAYIESHT
ncbi:MAG: acyl carrier protein [Clostridia bacterium]|jgi:acyl carrier protein|nr:acyl carrier protein [Clostridia bacterium]